MTTKLTEESAVTIQPPDPAPHPRDPADVDLPPTEPIDLTEMLRLVHSSPV